MAGTYDVIGVDYAELRRPDPRIGGLIVDALGDAGLVLNVGAGAGSYEPDDRVLVALEPSGAMIRQRSVGSAKVVCGCAEDLPFADGVFDASMAVLTVHHWRDRARGLDEMRRVTKGPLVILSFDPAYEDFWLVDYLPALKGLDRGKMPEMVEFEAWLGPVEVRPVLVPHDCSDGFLGAYWRRPEAYLDPRVRRAISCFWALNDITAGMAAGIERLRADLDSGAWDKRYGHLLALDAYDVGYRLVTVRS